MSTPPFEDGRRDCVVTRQRSAEKLEADFGFTLPENPPKMLFLSDLPDEQMVSNYRSSPPPRKLDEFEVKMRQEEMQLKVHADILHFLWKNWSEVSNELKEAENEWDPRVSYYSVGLY